MSETPEGVARYTAHPNCREDEMRQHPQGAFVKVSDLDAIRADERAKVAKLVERVIADHIGNPTLPPPKNMSEWGPVCAGCGTDEFRIDGYCSCECRDAHEFAEQVLTTVKEGEA